MVFVVAVAGVIASTAASADDGVANRRRTLQADAETVRAAGATGVLARVRDGHGSGGAGLAARAGVADLGAAGPVPWDAYYRIGSTTKTFTATVVLQLVAEGRLRLDDTVERWLPGVVRGNGNDGARVTVDGLLHQTSGLNDYDEHLPWALDFTPERFRQERFHAYAPRELVALAMAQPPQEPGRWSYSNTNYVLAGMIVEAVTGHPLAEEIHDRIVAPLGLRHTILAGTSAQVPQPRATGYTQFPGRADLVDTSVFVPFPDAPIVSTTDDVVTFMRALMSGRLLSAPLLVQMKQTVDTGDGERYGLGISWRAAPGCADGVWSHGGTMPGYLSEAAVTGDGRRAVAAVAMTWRPGDDRQTRQEEAMTSLVDHALCG